MSKKELKTNAMRFLDRNKIPNDKQHIDCDKLIDGISVDYKNDIQNEQFFKQN